MFFIEDALDFGHYTMEARRTIGHALTSVEGYGGAAIAPEHLALGLLEADVHASGYLPALGIRAEDLRSRLAEVVPRSQTKPHPDSGGFPLDDKAKAILRLAYRGSKDAGREKVTSGDILLGVLNEGSSAAARVLAASGLSADDVRKAIRNDQERGSLPPE